MEKHIIEHFRQKDPVLYGIIQKLGNNISDIKPRRSYDYFTDLCEAIVSQQLSEKAARTIYGRFTALFPAGIPTPELIESLDDTRMRNAGMSWSKVRYVKVLAHSAMHGDIDFNSFDSKTDDEIISILTSIHGVGPWTAEMFLMFSLGRPDVFSSGDVGLQRAMKQLYGYKKNPGKIQLSRHLASWAPYRTYACRLLWKSLEMKNILQ